ncbi:MAG TPA: type II toxin-antitoxin system Phd/YefM family antitoxin [Spirochaetia bacterium]|nr:type II toxin-antitoxin system Phd/YefM family antitoxin [Spirochaetia bacterium]
MRMVNVTEVRVNIRKILAEIAKTKEPVVILQRSRPAGYLVDPDTFDRLQRPADLDSIIKSREQTIESILELTDKIAREEAIPRRSSEPSGTGRAALSKFVCVSVFKLLISEEGSDKAAALLKKLNREA